MSVKSIYDIYDLEGKRIISAKSASEIASALGVTEKHVGKCYREQRMIAGIYYVEKVFNPKEKSSNSSAELILSEWERVTSLFKNVEWVKTYSPGVKKLVGVKC